MKMKRAWKRVLAAALCFCIVVGGVRRPYLPARAEGSGDVAQTNFYVEHVYLGTGLHFRQYGYICRAGYDDYDWWFGSRGGNYDYDLTDGAEKGNSWYEFNNKSGKFNEFGVHIYPTPQSYYDETFTANVEEIYTGYEIVDGNEAVTWVTEADAPAGGHFWIRYNQDVQNVVLYLFYSYGGETLLGANFGTDLKGVPGVIEDQDVLEVTKNNLSDVQTVPGLSDAKVGDIIYNTAPGLHTEKRVSADVLEDGRTFDVSLESWYTAGSNAADVGFILDSSGSMAFASGGSMDLFEMGEPKAYEASAWDKGYGLYVPLGTDCFNGDWFTPGNTDNSPLAYSSYSYYVFDKRDTVKELVPLAYWDGEMDGAENPLKKNLVGLYQFDRTKSSGDDELNFYKNGVSGGGEANPTLVDHNKTGGDYKYEINDKKKAVFPTAGAFQAYDGSNNDKEDSSLKAHSTLKLDAVVNNPQKFTISFAVKVTKKDSWVINNSKPYTTDGPRAQDLVTITNDDGEELYTILRGTRTNGGSQNHIRWQKAADTRDTTAYVDLKSILTESYNEKWRVFTYVVENGTVTAYVDGKEEKVENNTTLDLGDSPLSFTLGGNDKFKSGPTLQIDEVYIYDGKALTDGEVSKLVATMKDPTGSVLQDEDAKYANVNGTMMSVYDNEQFSKIGKDARAGWYYVNSTSNYDDITATGSAKSLHGLSGGTYPEKMGVMDDDEGKYVLYQKYELVDSSTGKQLGFDYENTDSYTKVTDKTVALMTGGKITKASPSILYMGVITKEEAAEYGVTLRKEKIPALYCVFSPAGGDVQVSPVFVKYATTNSETDEQKQATLTKAQNLQIALNTFINRLRVNSPESKVSAVRFSAEVYKDHEDELLLQTWTSNPAVSTGMMNLSQGAKETGMAKATDYAEVDGNNLYNYVITGGTTAYTGLKAFENKLAESVKDDKAKKYIILFTDGQDDELKEVESVTGPEDIKITNTQAVKLAEKLRSDGYTIFTVRLVSGDTASATGEKAEAFLTAIAGGKENYFKADTAGALEKVFASIIDKMPFKLTGYTVKDYIDPRFDLVAEEDRPDMSGGVAAKDREIIHLHDGGTIHIGKSDTTSTHYDLTGDDSGGKEFYFATAAKKASGGYTERYTKATLKYDAGKGLYYLEWDNQNIPLSRQGAHNLSVWSAVITLRAKEDFIGGNAILTDGPESGENMVFHPKDTAPSSGTDRANLGVDDKPSKGFPRTQVNVKPYRMVTDPTVDVRYLGETMNPKEALETLFSNAEGEIRDLDHLDVLLAEWNNRDGSGYYYEYVKRYIDYKNKNTSYGETKALKFANFDAFIQQLLTGKEITLNYSFLPAVTDSTDPHAHGTQTGGNEYETDKLGTIKYKWEAVTGDGYDETLTAGADLVDITTTAPKRYKLTVSYKPDTVEDRKTAKDVLITDGDYKDPKAPVGTADAPDPAQALHTTYVVSGKLSLKAEAPTETLQKIVDGEAPNVTVTGGTATDVTFTLTQNALNAAPEVNGVRTVYLTADKELPMGDYTLELTTLGDFTGLDAADPGDYAWDRFTGIPTGTNLDRYIVKSPSGAVTFKFGDTNETTRTDARAGLAVKLADWVDRKIDSSSLTVEKKHDQSELNALTLDPTWAEQNDDFALPEYLNYRLGMGSAFIAITPPAEITLTTSKTFTNSEDNDTQVGFGFTLTPKGGSMPVSTATAVFKPRDSMNRKNVTFDTLTFDRPGTYTYIMAETAQELEGFTFDDRTYEVQITVSNDGAAVTLDGVAQPQTALTDNKYTFDLSDKASFTNTYTLPMPPKPVTVKLGAEKLLDGDPATKSGQFTFHLWGDNDVNQTAENDEAGDILFESIKYTEKGMYTYSLLEVAGKGNFVYDRNVYKIKVTVDEVQSATESGTELQVTSVTANNVPVNLKVTSAGVSFYDLATFENETMTISSNQVYIRGTKMFVNGEDVTVTFTYELKASTGSNAVKIPVKTASPAQASPAQASSSQASQATGEPNTGEPGINSKSGFMSINTEDVPLPQDTMATTNGSGTFEFGPIEFTEAGTYTYIVSEVKGADPDVYYDDAQYKITFNVNEDSSSGGLLVESPIISVDGKESGSILFLNTVISKTGNESGRVEVGDTLTYNVSWANFSRERSKVEVRDLFDPGVNFKSARFTGAFPEDFTQENNLYIWTFNNQDPGDAGSIEIKTEVNEKAQVGWEYTSSDGILSGKTGADEENENAVVYNQACVMCVFNGMPIKKLTQTISNRVKIPSKTGSLTISKIVVDETGGALDADTFTFTVQVDDANGSYKAEGNTETDNNVDFTNGSATVTLRHGQSVTIKGLPENANYRVTEEEATGYTTTASDAYGKIIADRTMISTFTNTKTQEPSPGTGSLAISKTVTGDGGEQDREFHFEVEMPGAADNTYSGVSFENGRTTLTLKSGEHKTIEGLPAGASYTVTEKEANTDGYTTSSVGAEGTIPADGTVQAAFTNDKPSSPSSGGEPGPGGDEPGPTDPSVDPPSQDPDAPTSPSQDPDASTSPSQDPNVPASPSHDSGSASGSGQNPGATVSPAPSPDSHAASAPGSTDKPLYLLGPGGTSGSGGSGGATAPVTGDNTPILPLLLLLIVSGVCMVVILRKKKDIDS